jgi:hypothetical protein
MVRLGLRSGRWLPLYRWRFLAVYALLAASTAASGVALYAQLEAAPPRAHAHAPRTAGALAALNGVAAHVVSQFTPFGSIRLVHVSVGVDSVGGRPLDRIALVRNLTAIPLRTRSIAVFELCGPNALCTFPSASELSVRAAAAELALGALAHARMLHAALVLIPPVTGAAGGLPPRALYAERSASPAGRALLTQLARRTTLVQPLPRALRRAVVAATHRALYFVRPSVAPGPAPGLALALIQHEVGAGQVAARHR